MNGTVVAMTVQSRIGAVRGIAFGSSGRTRADELFGRD